MNEVDSPSSRSVLLVKAFKSGVPHEVGWNIGDWRMYAQYLSA